jgi:hypothetical protein
MIVLLTFLSTGHNARFSSQELEAVGKSQIIKAIVAGMNLIRRKDEVVLMAPTGAAADNIGGNTYYTSLGISIDRSRETRMKSRVRWLWSHKTIMIVDEVSMMDLHMINVIDNQCKIARALDRSCLIFSVAFLLLSLLVTFSSFHLFWARHCGGNHDEA